MGSPWGERQPLAGKPAGSKEESDALRPAAGLVWSRPSVQAAIYFCDRAASAGRAASGRGEKAPECCSAYPFR